MDASRSLWFVGSHIRLNVLQAENAAGIGVMRLVGQGGTAPPWHVHHREDEIFHVVAGTIRFQVGEASITAGPGDSVVGPRGVPHGFRILSETAEMLVITHGGFEAVVRQVGEPAKQDGPPPRAEPTPNQQQLLQEACVVQGIEILGPPIG